MLPRILHQTWRDHLVPHEVYFPQWIASWRELNPGWEYRFWTDRDNDRLVAHHYPEFLPFYQSIDRGVIRADVARALYLHRHGGLYVDMDFVCLQPMEPLIAPHAGKVVLALHASPRQPLPNAWLYSPPGNDYWLRFLRSAAWRWQCGERVPENVAGPNLLYLHDGREWASGNRSLHRIDPGIIYPYVWSDEESRRKAEALDWHDLSALRAAWPHAHAVTRWSHHW